MISVTFDGHPYRIAFTGRIGIYRIADGTALIYQESDDGHIINIEYDQARVDRDRATILKLEQERQAWMSDQNEESLSLWWGQSRDWVPRYAGSILASPGYIDGLVETAREEERASGSERARILLDAKNYWMDRCLVAEQKLKDVKT